MSASLHPDRHPTTDHTLEVTATNKLKADRNQKSAEKLPGRNKTGPTAGRPLLCRATAATTPKHRPSSILQPCFSPLLYSLLCAASFKILFVQDLSSPLPSALLCFVNDPDGAHVAAATCACPLLSSLSLSVPARPACGLAATSAQPFLCFEGPCRASSQCGS